MYIFPSKLSIITKLPPLHTTALNISNETLHYCQMSLGFMVRFTVGVDGRLGVNVLQPVVSDFKAGKDSVTLTPTSRVLQEGMMLRRVGHHAQVSASILLFAGGGGGWFFCGGLWKNSDSKVRDLHSTFNHVCLILKEDGVLGVFIHVAKLVEGE